MKKFFFRILSLFALCRELICVIYQSRKICANRTFQTVACCQTIIGNAEKGVGRKNAIKLHNFTAENVKWEKNFHSREMPFPSFDTI